MQYVISFFEGIITFISPCLLPMLPIYITYFAGGKSGGRKKALVNALGFCIGFTLVFVLLGAFAGTLGGLLVKYSAIVNIVTGLIVIIFGLNFLGVLKIGFLNRTADKSPIKGKLGFFSVVLFGAVFSISWTPCVGAFLGSALMLASQQGSAGKGIILLLFYSLGLAIPFLISALLIDSLKTAFNFIKAHYNIINIICGCLLVIIGILMATGLMSRLLSLLA